MKRCSYCNIDYESSEIRCPSCAATEAKNICAYCGTIHKSKYCPDCGFGIHEELISCNKCGHKTKSRICSRCGYDTATTGSIKETATSIISKTTCSLVGHKWLGCKCTTCGEIRDKGHEFQLLKDKCLNKCVVCDKAENAFHQWNHNKCTHCGAPKGFANTFWETINKVLPFIDFQKSRNKAIAGLFALLLFLFAVLGVMAAIESATENKHDIKVTEATSSYEEINYENSRVSLTKAGSVKGP